MSTGKQVAMEAIRQHLLQRSASLLAGNGTDSLGLALRRFFPELKQAFVMNSVPEQAEDIYWVLVSPTDIAEIEIPRGIYAENSSPSLKMLTLEMYQKKRHSRDVRQRLKIAVELFKGK
jgi:hypothetical protein